MQLAGTMKRILGLGFAMFALASCKGTDSTGPSRNDPVGEYLLATLNGGGLPSIIFENSAGRITLDNATMLLRSDHSYVETRNYRTHYANGSETLSPEVENGSYAIVGTQITFSIPATGGNAAFSYIGATSSGDLTYTYQSVAYLYRKPS